ncbi:MAG: agmatine deiminase family protein [Bacteroidetes bacterium]|nr:agmatine deiminase family protein [Bacteroidota bacterium]
MIRDSDTNFLYLADCLPEFQPAFTERLTKVLQDLKIPYGFLPNTKDIWAKDFMPIQKSKDDFVQFTYDPDYLKSLKYQHLRSDTDDVCRNIDLVPKKSNVVMDGGNIIRTASKVIMCDKVFSENRNLSKSQLTDKLLDLLKTDQIIFIPWDTNDFTGHADGMVRFVDDNTVIINEPTNENREVENRLRTIFKEARLDIIEIPYMPTYDLTFVSAKGLHLNYLQMKQAIIVPVFNQSTDDKAIRLLENIFTGQNIVAIDCNEISADGGVLNCISWNILV